MANPFDAMQNTVFKTVQRTMGYPATWAPQAGGDTITATVLFKDATERAKILDVEYDPRKVIAEFQTGDLDALVTAVRSSKSEEVLIVNGQSYGVLQIISRYDGKTYYAEMQQL